MDSALLFHNERSALRDLFVFWVSVAGLVAAPILGCGGGGAINKASASNTLVTVLSSSKANDRLSHFFLSLNSFKLTNDAGNTVTVFDAPQYAELMHVNGTAEPLTTVSVPQGVYSSATISIGTAQFTCYGFNSSNGNVVSSEFGSPEVPSPNVTVNLESPIVIAGSSMGLSLDLMVSQSAEWVTCGEYDGVQPYSITPTFSLSPVNFTIQPSNSSNSEFIGLRGLIRSIDSSGTAFSVASADIPVWEGSESGPSWQIVTSDNTVYQGIAGYSQLAAGMPVDVDGTIQEDGTLLATRIAVYDANTANLSVSTGELLSISKSQSTLLVDNSYAQGYLPGSIGAAPFSFSNAAFLTSGQFTNLQSLPFAALFNAGTMAAGQNVYVSTHVLAPQAAPVYIPATSITLLPQTIDGTVSAVSSDGGFTTYAVTLSAYDLFPELAAQPGEATPLTNPDTIVVYANSSNTQMLNTNPIAVGSVMRFYGLVFNDNGTLRMDCAQIMDGVPE